MRRKIKAVIDTNIFIKGWFSGNEIANIILDAIDDRKIQLLFAQDTIGELVYVVKNFARHNIDEIDERILLMHNIMTLFYFSKSVNTMYTKCEPTGDIYDDMFLKCAIEGEADFLITDDFKHGMHDMDGYPFRIVGSEEFVKMFHN